MLNNVSYYNETPKFLIKFLGVRLIQCCAQGHKMKSNEERIQDLFRKGVLVNEELLNQELDYSTLQQIEAEADLIVLHPDYLYVITQQKNLVDWYDIDKYRVDMEKRHDDSLYQEQLQHFQHSTLTVQHPVQAQQQHVTSLEAALATEPLQGTTLNTMQITSPLQEAEENELLVSPLPATLGMPFSPSSVKIVVSYDNKPRKYVVGDFTNIFISRYRFLEQLLRSRQELQGTMTINRLLQKKEKDTVSIIGVVDDIGETKTGNLVFTLEDVTGKIKVVVTKSKKETYLAAKDIVPDEVIGLTGVLNDKIIFADSIVWPDVPNNHELKKGEMEEAVIFLSDIHVGSALFLKEEFNKFLRWINGELGNETQQELARKVKYIFIAGDLIDGVGVYPSQEEELELKDIKAQYEEFARLIKEIPPDKHIIMCPGNHDVVHLAEPQPAFYQSFAPGLFSLPNVTLVTNPAIVNIGKTETFPGFDVLLYHGYSFDYYVANVESIRANGGYHRADLIMKFLLKRRHLAPSFKSTPYYPSHAEDPLVIRKIPDFFITGHIHYSSIANYKGITMISGSCWQGKTSFQEKLGHTPEPGRVPIVNLKTRDIKVLKFA